jgi:nucleotide-binding universal stress UspA family protein
VKHKILVAIDESENAKRAVEFVAKTSLPEHEITLFSVIPDTAAICEMNSPELTPHFLAHQVEFCSMEDKKRELVEQAAQKAKAILQKAGFDEKNIKIKMVNRKKGIARDIINEAHAGYDTVVMGKKGLSGIKEFFLGSVSQKVLHGAEDLSVLLVN